MKEYRSLAKEKRRTAKELTSVKDGIEKANSSLSLCLEKTRELEERIEKKQTILTKERNTLESALEIWNMLGLRIDSIDNGKKDENGNASGDGKNVDGKYSLAFSKLDPQDLAKEYRVKVEVTNNKARIYELEPLNILSFNDIEKIENVVNDDEKPFDFRKLVVLVRKQIKANCKFN